MLRAFSRAEHFVRPFLTYLPSPLAVKIFSKGRTWFAHKLADELRRKPLPDVEPVTAWGLQFRKPLWNAAGMFKNGEGYYAMASQGAGAWVAGTTTSLARVGNTRNGITWPATAYPRSHAASNWMGLPNLGHAAVARTIAQLTKRPLCPIGVSVSADPGMEEAQALPGLVDGIKLYEKAGVDFLELNESCPNVPGHHSAGLDESLIRRLEYVHKHALKDRSRNMPVMVKFSVDTELHQIPQLIDMLLALEFDGIILGNTSTKYADHRNSIHPAERSMYDYFTKTFGGGLSGRIVKKLSLNAASTAAHYLSSITPAREFHVIRCGGIQSSADLAESARAGVTLHQWYTGYFEVMSYEF